jgi:hypothetical protein
MPVAVWILEAFSVELALGRRLRLRLRVLARRRIRRREADGSKICGSSEERPGENAPGEAEIVYPGSLTSRIRPIDGVTTRVDE